jgi:hypothetical protein
MRRLRLVEKENRKLKRVVADLPLARIRQARYGTFICKRPSVLNPPVTTRIDHQNGLLEDDEGVVSGEQRLAIVA